jgi:PAS domain S-box-containing protein
MRQEKQMNTRKTSHRNKAVPAPESEGCGSGKKIVERKQTAKALRCNYDFLLALSLAAQSVQQAHTPEDIYHALGREIKALGCDLVIFTCGEDCKHLHVTHTTLAADLLHAAEKLTGIQTRNYMLPVQPESVFARVIDGGNAEFLQQTEMHAAQALPKILHPLAKQLVTFLKVGRGIVAPLRVDAATVGIMAITGSNLEESNLPAVDSFAAQVAISLKNVRLTRQLQEELEERKRTEEQLQLLKYSIDIAPDGAYWMDKDGRFLYANEAGCRALGYTSEELMQMRVSEVNLRATPERWSQVWREIKKKKSIEIRSVHRRKDGSEFPVELTSTYVEFGKREYCNGFAKDITERIQTEEKIKLSEARYRSLVEAQSDLVSRSDLSGNLSFVNDAYCRTFGVRREQAPGNNFISTVFSEDVPKILNVLEAIKHPPYRQYIEIRNITPDGMRWFGWDNSAVLDERQNIIEFQGVGRDITERKLAEEKLRESERTLSNFIANSPDTIYLLDLENHTSKYLNCEEFCGYPKSVLESPASIMFALHPDDGPGVRANWQQILRSVNDKVTSCEYRLQRKDGNWEWILQRMTILARAVDDKPSRVLVTLSIITERKQAETKLKESEENFRLIAETIREVFYTYDPLADKFLYVSPAYETLWQEPIQKIYDDPRSFTHAVHPEDRERFFAAVQREREGGEYFNMQYRIVRPDGTMRNVHSRNYPVFDASGAEYRVVGIAEDITIRKRAEEEILKLNIELEQRVEDRTHELRQAQEQLVRQEKLAVLGQLAGSVGHELRNPLAVIKNALYYLKIVGANGNEKVREYLGIIESEARTAEKIINDLLEFARVKAVDMEVVPASRLVEYVLERHPAPGNVRVTVNIPANLPMLYIDPRQMEQVIGNLFVNACQAMGSGGELVITAREEQGMVAIAVRDTGGGIPPENISRLFEPLFTTKTKGIGLGLAVSKKLTEANGGRIEVQSEVGIGTTFTVYLPVKHDKHVEDNP